ncbi:MAG TPA: ATP-binding protein [Caulobacteraceae bacterium]|nr:ATP-binding protein [Caulobacteraceae bacterium]
MTAPDSLELHSLLATLAERDDRAQAAASVAEQLGALALLVLLPDPEIGALRPAPGLSQTLPGGSTWAALLDRCASPGEFKAQVAFPDMHTLQDVDVWVGADGAAVLLVGGAPKIRAAELAQAAPLLLTLFRAEARADAAIASARTAGDTTRRATALASSLDRARSQLAEKAVALRVALADAARLNHELQALNETLDARVQEEMAERLKAEEALRQAQKMEAIGQLTGGVAHDFNNLLTVIIGGIDNIRRQLQAQTESVDRGRIRRSLDMAAQAATRAATLTARLLAFSRRQALNPQPVHVDQLVRELGEMLHGTLGETIQLEIVGSPGLWPALADAGELQHALLNLAVNSRDAMPEGGALTIETGNVFLDDAYLAAVAEPVTPGQYVLIAVSDTGDGMDAETLSRVFEPFFTTKDPGKGTGLGLSQVYGFVRQSGGHVRIYSEVGQGTTVKLYLPRLHGEAAIGVKPVTTRDVGLLRGAETVLLVEDDEGVRAYSGGVLRDLGYRVIEAGDAASALEALRAEPAIDLLFTDVVLPGGVHGRQLADEVRKLRPRVRVLYTSGYTRNAIVHNGRLDPGVQLLTKPFSYEELAERVRRVLDAGHGPVAGEPSSSPPANGAVCSAEG